VLTTLIMHELNGLRCKLELHDDGDGTLRIDAPSGYVLTLNAAEAYALSLYLRMPGVRAALARALLAQQAADVAEANVEQRKAA
jgi:hypothetical protein